QHQSRSRLQVGWCARRPASIDHFDLEAELENPGCERLCQQAACCLYVKHGIDSFDPTCFEHRTALPLDAKLASPCESPMHSKNQNTGTIATDRLFFRWNPPVLQAALSSRLPFAMHVRGLWTVLHRSAARPLTRVG